MEISVLEDDATKGAVEIARHWLRHPGRMTDAGFEQVCRELYTVSRALVRIANRAEAESADSHSDAS